MKKLFATILALALALSMSVNAFAAEGSATVGENGSQDIEVTAKYDSATSTPTVYSVDITWEDMTFVYQEAGAREWNPADHTYTEIAEGSWNKTTAGVTVTNHSNAAVTVDLAYTAVAGTGVTGTLNRTSETLLAGIENEYEYADGDTFILTISGTPVGIDETGMKIGTITVTIS